MPRSTEERLPAGTPVPRVSAAATGFSTARADLAVCFVFENEKSPAVPGLPASHALSRTLAGLMRDDKFHGKRKESILWHSAGRYAATRYLVLGLGKRAAYGGEALRDGCGLAARRALGIKARRMVIALPASGSRQEDPARLAVAATEGAIMGSYRMSKYMTGEEGAPAPLRNVELLVGRDALAAARTAVARGMVRAEATSFVRDLVNEPAGALTPQRMAEVARAVAKEQELEIKVLERKDLEKIGAGALLGVAAGSAQPPCLIHMVYRPAGARDAPKIALVGKGLTFDSGGLSLKTASGMETMKLDKAGAAVVLGVMRALSETKPAVEVHGIMGMTENMPSGSATKPGDVLRTMGGKTIEVLNTDAEGRLVLADCLAYAQRLGVSRIVDLATLTGACMVALGPVVTGVFGNDQEMIDDLIEASRQAGERMWQLPLYDDYNDQLRSDVADIKNSPTSRYGGAITAALFLKHFLTGQTSWIHLDIAGPAFLESEQGFMRKGATGAAVRTLLTWLDGQSSARPS